MDDMNKQTDNQVESPAQPQTEAQSQGGASGQDAQQPATATDSRSDTEAKAAEDGAGAIVAKLAAAEAKLAEAQDAFLRAKAETENMRRRAQEDISRAHKFAIESFAEALLPVMDSLEMALKVETPSIESLKEGVDMTLKQLCAAFEKNKLLEIHPAAGEKLDPMKHQAISAVPAEQESNTVVAVLQKGYTISDRLLRPALVTVAQGK